MAGPWEKYQSSTPAAPAPTVAPQGPWDKYRGNSASFERNPMLGVFQPMQQVNTDAKGPRYLTPGEYVADLAASGATGLGKGVVALAGAPADLFNLGQYAGSRLLGETPEDRAAKGSDAFNVGPTTEKITKTINDATGNVLGHMPRSAAGDVAERIGEYAPAVAAGPGSIGRKVVMTAAPAVAGVAAKSAAEGTPFEPYAEPIAAIAAGGIAAGTKGNLVKQIAKNAPTHEAVKIATNAMYDKLRSAGIVYDANAYQNMAAGLLSKLTSAGFRKAQAPLTADALQAVADQVGKSPDFNDFESIRKITSNILREKNATDTDKKAAGVVLDALDGFASKSPFATNGSVSPSQVAPLMKDAREMARRNILAKQVEDMLTKAETYQSGYEAGLRNQFSNYLRSNKAKGLTQEERQAFMQAAKGNWSNNLLGSFGRLGVDFGNLGNRATLLPGGAIGGGFAAGEPITGAAIVAAATGAKYAARQQTNAAAKRALGTVLAGRDAQKNAASTLRTKQIDVMLRRLITGETARLASRPIAPDFAIEPKRENSQ